MHTFVHDLPATFPEYAKLVNQTFPLLIDTKVLANHLRREIPRVNNYVEGLYKDCFENDDVLRKFNNIESSWQGTRIGLAIVGHQTYHDAAFDAYVTGVFFVCYNNYLDNKSQ